jgi:hypothetical protein
VYHYNLDKLTAHSGLISGWGWFVDELAISFPTELVLTHEDGAESAAVCLRSGRREDVGVALPQIRHAAESGFLIQGRLLSSTPISTGMLRLGLPVEGEQRELPVPNVCSLLAPGSMHQGAARVARAVERNGLLGTARIAAQRAAGAVQSYLKRMSIRPARGDGATLVIDHNLGGGANVFRHQLVSSLRTSGDVFVLTARVQTPTTTLVLECFAISGIFWHFLTRINGPKLL